MATLKTAVSKSPTQTTLIDQPDASTTYIGIAKTGEATTAAVWQIRLVKIIGNVTSIKYANGSDAFNQIWDSRASLSYS